jgi:starch synthase
VAGGLPKALRALGHEPIVILPTYSQIDAAKFDLRPFLAPLGVWMGNTEEWSAVQTTTYAGVPFYFIESNQHFDRFGLYHDEEFDKYWDNGRRFGFFTRAALQLCRDMGFAPDIVHAHDWPTALAPAYLKIWHWNDPVLGGTASVLTIHNLAHQGKWPAADYDYLGLQHSNFTGDNKKALG